MLSPLGDDSPEPQPPGPALLYCPDDVQELINPVLPLVKDWASSPEQYIREAQSQLCTEPGYPYGPWWLS